MATFGVVGVRFAVQNVQQVNAAIAGFRRQVTFLGGSSLRFGADTTRAMTGVGASALSAGRNMQTFGMMARNAGHNLKSLGNELAAVGFRLGFLLSLPIGSFFANTVGNAMKFETEMTKIVTIVGIADSEVSKFSKSILDMAVELGKTPVELAKALFFITSSGARDSATAMNILTQSAKLSAIGFGETKSVASALVSAVRAYGEENLNAAEAADVLANTVRFGKIEAQKLSPALGRVIGIAAAMGVSFQEVGAFLAVFTQSGVEAGIAVTGLRAALTSILKPTGKAKDLLEQLGYTVQDVQKFISDEEGVGLAKGLVAITRAFEAANIPIVELFGNVRGLAGVLFNTGEAAQLYTQILDEMNRSLDAVASGGGVVETAFERVKMTTAFQAEQMKAAWQVAAIAIGDIFLPAINRLLGGLIGVLGVLRDLAKARPGLILLATTLFLMAAALAPILVIMGLLISITGTLIGVFGGFVAMLGALLGPLGAVKIVLAGLVALFAISFSQIVAKLGVDVGRIRYIMNNELRPGLVQSVKDATAQTQEALKEFGSHAFTTMDSQFRHIETQARTWGHNIVVQLANGLAQGAIVVVRALIQIGNLFRQWLAPGSPPALLPDLPDWGRNIMEQLMRGFMLADFSIFDSISSMMERFFRSLPTEIMSEEGLIPAIMGSRSVITAAINQLREIGHITGDVLQQIAGHFGPISSDIMGYISSLLNLENATNAVKAAQEKLNQATEKWADRLRPITTELKSIRDRRKMMEEELRLTRLRQILVDPRAPVMAKELAAMEIREIMLERQLRTQEDLRDAELEAVNAELEAARESQRLAQEQVDTQKALIDVQIRNNELMNEYLGVMERLANAASGGAGGGAGGGLGSPINFDDFVPDTSGLPSLVDLIGAGMDDLKKPFEEFLSDWQLLWEDVKKEFAPLKKELDTLAGVWSDVFIRAGRRIWAFGGLVRVVVEEEVIPIITSLGEEASRSWNEDIKPFTAGLWEWLTNLRPSAELLWILRNGIKMLGFAFWVAGLLIKEAINGLVEDIKSLAGDENSWFAKLLGAIQENVTWQNILKFAFLGMVGAILVAAGVITLFITMVRAAIWIIDRIVSAILNMIDGAKRAFMTFHDYAKGEYQQLTGDLLAPFQNLIAFLYRMFLEPFQKLWRQYIRGELTFGQFLFRATVQAIINAIMGPIIFIIGLFVFLVESIVDGFKWLWNKLVGNSIIPDLVNEIIKWLTDTLPKEVIAGIDTWIKEMIQKFTDFGVDSITAIANGITSQLVMLTTTLTTLLSSAVQAAIAALPPALRGLFDGSGFSIPNPFSGGGDSGTSSAPGTPPVASPPVSAPPVYSPGSGGSQPTSTFMMGGVTVNNGMDVAVLESIIRRVVTESI